MEDAAAVAQREDPVLSKVGETGGDGRRAREPPGRWVGDSSSRCQTTTTLTVTGHRGCKLQTGNAVKSRRRISLALESSDVIAT